MIRAISSVCWSGPPNLLILNQKRKSKYTVVQGPEAFRSGSLGSHVVAVNPVELAHQKSRRNPAGQGQRPVRRPACGSGLQMVLPRVPTRGRDNFARPFLSQGLVVSQVVPFCRHPRECPCIFQRKVGTLSQKREVYREAPSLTQVSATGWRNNPQSLTSSTASMRWRTGPPKSANAARRLAGSSLCVQPSSAHALRS